MSDTDFLASVLSDGNWHSLNEIIARSIAERGCGLTPHSRASDLRKRGYRVEVDVRHDSGRAQSFYRMDVLGGVAAPSPGSLGQPGNSDDVAPGFAASAPATPPSTPIPAAPHSQGDTSDHAADASRGGVLQLFNTVDESATSRGAYTEEEAA